MNWYKIELTAEDLTQKVNFKIEEQIESIRSTVENPDNIQSFQTSASVNPKTIYLGLKDTDEGLFKVLLDQYGFDSCEDPSLDS
jgi:hypothetical protein